MNEGSLQVSTPSESEVRMVRRFEAPREAVFDAFTRAELVQRWLLGPDGWSMPVCEIDLRVGGAWRYEWAHPERDGFAMHGTYRELERPARIIHTERFGEHESVVTTTFAEVEGEEDATLVTMTVDYGSREGRDAVLESGMTGGVERSYERLEGILSTLA